MLTPELPGAHLCWVFVEADLQVGPGRLKPAPTSTQVSFGVGPLYGAHDATQRVRNSHQAPCSGPIDRGLWLTGRRGSRAPSEPKTLRRSHAEHAEERSPQSGRRRAAKGGASGTSPRQHKPVGCVLVCADAGSSHSRRPARRPTRRRPSCARIRSERIAVCLCGLCPSAISA